MNIFVSYTTRDGVLDGNKLRFLEARLSRYGRAYIDLLHNHSRSPQAHVIKTLMGASVLCACVTPGFYDSEWVQIELLVARLRGIPVVPVEQFDAFLIECHLIDPCRHRVVPAVYGLFSDL
jgi:hypothetical protein